MRKIFSQSYPHVCLAAMSRAMLEDRTYKASKDPPRAVFQASHEKMRPKSGV
jgi:hypothetical protein